MKQKKKQIVIISAVLLALVLLAGLAAWFMFRPDKQVEVASGNELDVEWYDVNATEFTITTMEQMYDLAKLSKKYDFAGQTIKLGADIVFNEGNADDWGMDFPEYVWDIPINNFAGTFDGQGHTISGIYCMGFLYTVDAQSLKPLPAGLFANTKPECVIKNFRLVNSYFCGDLQDGAGTISACGGGTFDSIYSNAKLVSYKYFNGGIIGKASESTTVTNCWYDGDMEIPGGYPRYTAGIMGRAMNPEGEYRIEHCLVTSTMYNETEKTGVAMAGIVGNVIENGSIKINDCFVDGSLYNEYNVGVGSIYGVSEKNSTPTITNTYATEETHEKTLGAILGNKDGFPVAFPKATLTGIGGYQWTTLDFDNYWSAVEGSTPILTTFADDALSLVGVEKMVDTSWYSADAKEFVLKDLADLYGFAILSQSHNFENQTVKLGADITVNTGMASGWGKDAPAYTWKSIGSNTLPFAGTFDGQMHTVSGIYLSAKTPYAGFFSTTATTATVKNFKLKNSYLETSNLSFGSIAGRGRGTFDTIYSDAIVVSDGGNVGGIIGQVPGDGGVTMKNCWFAGSVTSLGNDKVKRNTGGLIGVSYSDSTVSNCLFTGTVDASAYVTTNSPTSKVIAPVVGGFVGQISNKSVITITESLSTGKVKYNVKATGAYGSIIGWSESGAKLSEVYASEETCSYATQGKNISGGALVLAKEKLIGVEGYRWTTLDFEKYWVAIDKSSPALKSFAGKKINVKGVAKMVDVSWYNAKKDVFVLKDVADLYGLAYLSANNNFAGKTVKLDADMVVNTGNASDWAKTAPSNEWVSIGSKKLPFAGSFDGQMHTISGIYLNSETNTSGLFAAAAQKSEIKNLRLSNSFITSSEYSTGGVVGLVKGLVDTVYVDDTVQVVSSKQYVGGIAGLADGKETVIRNCWFAGNVTNTANHRNYRGTAGILGGVYIDSHVKIEGCLNTGIIDVTAYVYDQDSSEKVNVAPLAAGIVGVVEKGISSVEITNCLNTKEILVSDAVTGAYGAIVGYTNNIKGTVVSETYTTEAPVAGSKINGEIYKVSAEDISGYKAFQWTFLDFDKYWAVVKASTPVLKSFGGEQLPSAMTKMFDFSWVNEAKGTEKDPYRIADAADLYGLAILSVDAEYNGFKGKTIKVVDDIEANKAGSTEHAWKMIGSKALPFQGTFDGDMHTISGIYLVSDTNSSGMFGATAAGSVVKNIRLSESYLESSEYSTGGIVGLVQGLIDTVYVDDTVKVVSSKQYVGGIAGLASGKEAVIQNSWFAGSVTNTGNHRYYRGTGGILGAVYAGNNHVEIKGCLNTGTIDVTAYVYDQDTTSKVNISPIAGGILGQVEKTTASAKITNCLNTEQVLVSSVVTGGHGAIIGYTENVAGTVMSQTYTTATPSAGSSVSGKIYQVSEEEIIGYKAYQWTLLDFDKYWAVVLDDIATTGEDESGTPILKAWADEVPTLKAEDKMIDTSWLEETDGDTKDTAYVITDRADLYGLALLSVEAEYNGFKDKFIKVDKDIVINEGKAKEWISKAPDYNWTSIGSHTTPFAGNFDGQGHTISGLYSVAGERFSGLFAEVAAGATIQNLRLVNSYFSSAYADAGSITGLLKGTAASIYSDAIVEVRGERSAGMFGQANGANITNCWFAGSVTTKSNNATRIGGFVGETSGALTISNCLNTGIIDVSGYKIAGTNGVGAGGFIGRIGTTVKIDACLNIGKIKAQAGEVNYGPIVGQVWNNAAGKASTIENTYALVGAASDGTVTGSGALISKTYTSVEASAITGEAATTGAAGLFADANKEYWSTVSYASPVLTTFKDLVIDTTWYDGVAGSTYYIYDIKDLYGFVELAKTNNFAGMTVKLANDITVNEGDARDWAIKAPLYSWTSIGTSSKPFTGTFDGQGCTISGLYMNSGARRNAMFAMTNNATIKNFKLMNSYFRSTTTGNADIGSIIGTMQGGLLESVYTDAIVVGSGVRIGGLVATAYTASSEVSTIKNCWFAGNVITENAVADEVGGILGASSGIAVISNCLNTGTINTSAFKCTRKTSNVEHGISAGGIIGRIGHQTTIDGCLNVGIVKAHADDKSYGPIAGNVWNSTNAKKSEIKNTYAIPCTASDATVYGDAKLLATTYTIVEGSAIKGEAAKTGASGLFAGGNASYWSTVSTGSPVLTAFKELVSDTSWYDGVAGSTYYLSDRADLFGFAELAKTHNFAGMTVKLANDIVINEGNAKEWAKKAPLYDWTQIGAYNASFGGVQFAGTFDGQGHTISGLYVVANNRYRGLFGATASGSTIQNFRLVNSYFSSAYADFGGVAGILMGNASGIYCNAIVDAKKERSAGMFGQVNGSTITNCWFDGVVTTKATTANQIGGIVGGTNGILHLNDSLNTGTIDASGCKVGGTHGVAAGGFVGRIGSTATIEGCLNVGVIKVQSGELNYGPIIGQVWNNANSKKSTIENTYAVSGTYGDKTVIGSTALIAKTYTVAEASALKGEAATTGAVGLFTAENAPFWTKVSYGSPILTTFKDLAADISWFDGVVGSTYYLSDKADLYGFAELTKTNNFAGMAVKLANDIVVNEGDAKEWASKAPIYDWTQIGTYSAGYGGVQFAGTFDGQGHTISGLYMVANNRFKGLFGATASGSTIKNFCLTNSYFKSNYADLGSVSGILMGNAISIYSDAIVDVAKERSGGMFGQTNGATITDCWYAGTVTTKAVINDEVGGIVGQVTGATSINNCLNSGTIDASGYNSGAGGIIGRAGHTVTVEGCLNVGTIKAHASATNFGPILGRVWNNANGKKSTIENTYALSGTFADGTVSGSAALISKTYTSVELNEIKGETAKTEAEGLFTDENKQFWSTVEQSYPVLTTFYDKRK